jgi:hypothetical protein
METKKPEAVIPLTRVKGVVGFIAAYPARSEGQGCLCLKSRKRAQRTGTGECPGLDACAGQPCLQWSAQPTLEVVMLSGANDAVFSSCRRDTGAPVFLVVSLNFSAQASAGLGRAGAAGGFSFWGFFVWLLKK